MHSRNFAGIITMNVVLFLFVMLCSGCQIQLHALSGVAENKSTDNFEITEKETKTDDYYEQVEIPRVSESELFNGELPQYTGNPAVSLNNDIPLFAEDEINSISDVIYSDFDDLGRCGTAVGLLGPETIPTVSRESILDIKPSGWHTVRYDDRIEDRYLYNRCHLIGYQLAGANAEPRNLITGTRYLNIEGMLPYENAVYGYIIETKNHVLYRVTPIFIEDDLVASGVLMEAYSLEDNGEGIQFCKYVFNVQPGVIINYKTGDSQPDSTYVSVPEESEQPLILLSPNSDPDSNIPDRSMPIANETDNEEITYVLNLNTKRFHYPYCPSVEDMKAKNRAYSKESREVLIEEGYVPCGRCNP